MRKQLLLSTGILCLMLAPAVSYGQGPGERRDEQKQMRPAEAGKGAASQERGAERGAERAQERTPERTQERPQERSQGAEQRAPGAAGRDEKGAGSRQSEERSKAGSSNERPATASDDKRGRGDDAKSGERDSRHGDSNRDDARGKSAEQDKSKDGAASARKEREGTSAAQKEPGRDQREGAKNAADRNANEKNPAEKNATEQGRDNNRDANRPSTATDTTRTQSPANAQNAPAGSVSQTQTSQRSNIAVDKQVRISETLRRERLAAPERDLNVSIRVGERIPDRVRVHRLPDTIVSIEPEYRDYDYFTTDDEIVIVEPRTHQIVSQIPRDPSRLRAAEGTGRSSGGSGYSGATAAAGDASPCRILRRDTAGNVTELTPQTVGSTAQQDFVSVIVRVPGGATTAPISMGAPDGQIVVSSQRGADCTVTIEPPAR